MKRVLRSLVLGGLAAAAGYAALVAAGDGTVAHRWADRLVHAASVGHSTSEATPAERSFARAATAVSAQASAERATFVPPPAATRVAEAGDDTLPKPFSNARAVGAPASSNGQNGPPADVRPVQRPLIPAEARPTAEDGRRRLASSIQSELKRVGCYAGEVDGEWGSATQRAMRDFNGRINASLPIEQPDYILLTLLQGHAERACAAGCPDGQTKADNGTCPPRRSVTSKQKPQAAKSDQTATASVGAMPGTTAIPIAPPRPSAEVVLAPPNPQLPPATEPEYHRTDPPRTQPAAPRRATAEVRAEIQREQARLAAAVERRKKELDKRKAAREEADRLARLAEAERVRAAEESKRLAALAAAAADQQAAIKRQRAAPQLETRSEQTPARATERRADIAAAPSALDAAAAAMPSPPSIVAAEATPSPAVREKTAKTSKVAKRETAQRFAARPRTPPPYFVGRLPPRYVYWGPTYTTPPSPPRKVARRGGTQAIFPYLSRYSP